MANTGLTINPAVSERTGCLDPQVPLKLGRSSLRKGPTVLSSLLFGGKSQDWESGLERPLEHRTRESLSQGKSWRAVGRRVDGRGQKREDPEKMGESGSHSVKRQ